MPWYEIVLSVLGFCIVLIVLSVLGAVGGFFIRLAVKGEDAEDTVAYLDVLHEDIQREYPEPVEPK